MAACCRGTLALRVNAGTAARANALAAWLSHHGALLAELELDVQPANAWPGAAEDVHCQEQDAAAARLLGHVPGQLTWLVLAGPCSSDGGAAEVMPSLTRGGASEGGAFEDDGDDACVGGAFDDGVGHAGVLDDAGGAFDSALDGVYADDVDGADECWW